MTRELRSLEPRGAKRRLFAGAAPGRPDEEFTLEAYLPRNEVEYWEGES